ncbi:hypothetical protein ACFV42_23030 [Streptomyces solisilvae]|uniref:hypothetical protein n=1 Tax=Streptomyces malaysiensis TaxID=92644 RepID=UPI0036D1A020
MSTTILGKTVPPVFLAGPLKGRENKRNRDSAALAWERMTGFGYIPRVSPDGSEFFEVTGRHGETLKVWYGYPGTEHLMAVHCVLCNQDVYAYYSHTARGSSHAGCTVRGKANRVKAMEALTGAPVTMRPRQDQPNGYTKGTQEAAPVAEATEAAETADTNRTRAAKDAAESRPAPEPEAQPPKSANVRPLGSHQWRALDGMLNTSPGFSGLTEGEWDASRPGWHLGSVSRTKKIMDSLVRAGHVTREGAHYTITEQGRATHAADERTAHPDTDTQQDGPDDGSELDAGDRAAVGRLAKSAGLIPARKPTAPDQRPAAGETGTAALRGLLRLDN